MTPKQRLAAIVARLSVTHESDCNFAWLAEYAASLETQLENRRAVEVFCDRENGHVLPHINKQCLFICWRGNMKRFDGDTQDEAFAKAAGWVRER